MKRRIALAWSSGKDSAWALYVLTRDPDVEIAALVTTYGETSDRIPIHGVRRRLVEAQAASLELPLRAVALPTPCPNADYEAQFREELARLRDDGVTHVAFGDLHLEDIREYRERLVKDTGLETLFPIWRPAADTEGLAREMVAAGLRAVVVSVDPLQLSPEFAGRPFDDAFLSELPPGVDPCGERGEFHTFCYDGPSFTSRIDLTVGAAALRDGLWLCELTLAGDPIR